MKLNAKKHKHASAKNDDAKSLYKTARDLTGSRPNMLILVKNVSFL